MDDAGVGGQDARSRRPRRSRDGTQCDVIRSDLPCTVSFTPTAAMLNFPGPVYTYACTQSTCAPTQAVHDSMQGTITIVP